LGPYDSDIDPHEGINHAVRIARRIASGLSSGGDLDDDTIPSVVYASPFLRTAHTGYIVANELQSQVLQRMVLRSVTGYGTRYNDMNEKLKNVCNMMKGYPVVEEQFHREFSSLVSKYHHKIIEESRSEGTINDNGKRSNSSSQSPFKRIELRLEEGLWEWLIPSLLVTKVDGIKTNPRPVSELATILPGLESKRIRIPGLESKRIRKAAIIHTRYQSVNPYDDSGDVDVVCVPERSATGSNSNNKTTIGRPPRWTESEENLLERCETTLSRLLSSHNSNGDSICIVSHAPCDQAMAYSLEKAILKSITAPKDSKLTPWPLGGITVFSRPILYENDTDTKPCGFGDWTMDLYGDTEHMPGDYKTGLKKWSLPCFTKEA